MTELAEIPHVIDGEERPVVDGRTFESVNPATQAAWARVADYAALANDEALPSPAGHAARRSGRRSG